MPGAGSSRGQDDVMTIAALITKEDEDQAFSGCAGNICDSCGTSYQKEGDTEMEPEQVVEK